MTTPAPAPWGDVVNELGEGPQRLDAARVSWVDIAAGLVWRGGWGEDGGLAFAVSTSFPNTVGAALPSADGGLLVFAHDRLATIDSNGALRLSDRLPQVDRGMRFNDAAIDPAGRAYVGTLSIGGEQGRAALYRLRDDGGLDVVREGLNLANGLAWSPLGDRVFHVDSEPGVVWTAAYDVSSGGFGDWQVLTDRFDAVPDGMCVDATGALWVAMWGGSAVVRIDPTTGEEIGRLAVPAPHVTCCAFVGPDRDRLLVTTARNELDDDARAADPLAGRLFVAAVDVRGLPSDRRWSGRSTEPPWAVGSTRGTERGSVT